MASFIELEDHSPKYKKQKLTEEFYPEFTHFMNSLPNLPRYINFPSNINNNISDENQNQNEKEKENDNITLLEKSIISMLYQVGYEGKII
jgi:hypothetical protein